MIIIDKVINNNTRKTLGVEIHIDGNTYFASLDQIRWPGVQQGQWPGPHYNITNIPALAINDEEDQDDN